MSSAVNSNVSNPSREFHLLSAPFPSGLSWLVSVLTELNVCVTHANPRLYPNGFWQAVPGRPGCERIVPEGVSHMRYYLPLLQERNEFCFEPGVEVFWEHYLSFARRPDRPVFLFVRDPRDAIHSLYQRNYTAISFLDYLDRPEAWADHFPDMFHLPPAETWSAWHAMWMGLEGLVPVRVVRFEDSREEPLSVVRQVLLDLGLERSDADILVAVERSSFSKTKAAMQRAEAETGKPFRVARQGRVGEWRECYSAEELRRFGGPAVEWMRRFGYAPAPESELEDPSSFALDGTALPPELARFEERAWKSFDAGDLTEAKWILKQGMQARLGGEKGRLRLACDWTALDWTEKVLGELATRRPVAIRVASAFRDFTTRYGLWPSIRKMLLAAADQVHPPGSDFFSRLDSTAVRSVAPRRAAEESIPKSEPLLVEQDFLGFDLYGWGGRFYAVARSAQGPRWTSLTQPEVAALRKQGQLFVGDLSFEVKEAVQDHLARRGK